MGAAKEFTQGALTGAQEGWNYYTPNVALQKMREAISHFTGNNLYEALRLIKKAQETDKKLLSTLEDVFQDLEKIHEDPSTVFVTQSTPTAAAIEGPEEAEQEEPLSKLTFPEVKEILLEHMNTKIEAWQPLIDELEGKIADQQRKEKEWRNRVNSPEYRALHPRGF